MIKNIWLYGFHYAILIWKWEKRIQDEKENAEKDVPVY